MEEGKRRNTTFRKWISCLPGLLLLSAWPCIVHMDRVRSYMENETWYANSAYVDDFFLHARSIGFLVLSVWMAAILCIRCAGRRGKMTRTDAWEKLPVILLAVWFGLSVLSSLISPYRLISFAGLPESYETIPVLGGYLITCLYGSSVFRSDEEQGVLKKALIIGGFIQGLIGLGQFFNHDFWASGIGRRILLAGTGRDGAGVHFQTDAYHRVYLCFYNPNYAAVYILIVLPFAVEGIMLWLELLRRRKTTLLEMIYGAVCLATAILLTVSMFGTGSKAGRGLLLLFLPVYLLLFLRISGKKRALGLGTYVLALAAALIIMSRSGQKNLVTGALESAFPEKRAGTLLDVKLESGRVVFEFEEQNVLLEVVQKDGSLMLYVYDADTGTPIQLKMDEKTGRLLPSDENWHLPKSCLSFEAVMQETQKGTRADLAVWYRKKVPWHFRVSESGLIYLNPIGKKAVPELASQALPSADDRILTGRMYIWKRTLPLLEKAILLGYGAETYPFYFPQNDYVGQANVGAEQYLQLITRPHNMYLQILFNSGLPAFLCLLLAAGAVLYRHGRNARAEAKGRSAAAVMALLGFMILGLLYDSTVAVTPLLCILVAIA